jgi:hypothetical protein
MSISPSKEKLAVVGIASFKSSGAILPAMGPKVYKIIGFDEFICLSICRFIGPLKD